MTVSTNSYLGFGQVYIKNRGDTKPVHKPFGNVATLNVTIETDSKTLLNYRTGGGGVADQVDRITRMTGQVSVHDFKPRVLEIALRGGTTTDSTGAVTNEEHYIEPNSAIRLAKLPDTAGSFTIEVKCTTWATGTAYALGDVVKPTATPTRAYICTVAGTSHATTEPTWPTSTGTTVVDNGTLTWKCIGNIALTLDTDYTVSLGAIVIPSTATRFADIIAVQVDYTPIGAETVQALTASAGEYELFFNGLNEADSGNPFALTQYRIKFTPTDGLGFIADEFGAITMNYEVLLDSSISGTGISQYQKIQQLARPTALD